MKNSLDTMIQNEFENAPVGSDEWRKLLELKILSGFLNEMYEHGSMPEHIADMEMTIFDKLHELHKTDDH